jgi:CO/xanthine dehydrogenase Mo-binding subunit
MGMACTIHEVDDRHSDGFAGSNAKVEIWEDGKVVVYSGEGDYGQGRHTVFAQITAEILGVSLNDIRMCNPDTDNTPHSLGPWGSRVTLSGGIAVQRAAADAKEKVLKIAGDLLEANPRDLEIKESKIFVRGSADRFLTLAQVAREGLYRRGGELIRGHGTEEPDTVKMDVFKPTSPCSTYSFATRRRRWR